MVRSSSGHVLIARRPAGVHQGELWEFPGGKFEAGESPRVALARELAEELAITVRSTRPLCVIDHSYTDKHVRLHVQLVEDFIGQPHGAEGQPLIWVKPFDLWRYQFPTANRAILRHLALPRCLAIAGPCQRRDDFSAKFARALDRGVDGLYLRFPANAVPAWIYPLASELCTQHDCLLFTQLDQPAELGRGRHWRSGEWALGVSAGYPQSAAVHTMAELEAAQAAGADLLLASPVQATASHPAVRPLGWDRLGAMAGIARVPVLALGGVTPADGQRSRSVGGFGVAGVSAFWG